VIFGGGEDIQVARALLSTFAAAGTCMVHAFVDVCSLCVDTSRLRSCTAHACQQCCHHASPVPPTRFVYTANCAERHSTTSKAGGPKDSWNNMYCLAVAAARVESAGNEGAHSPHSSTDLAPLLVVVVLPGHCADRRAEG
jgi:hypothetical protein